MSTKRRPISRPLRPRITPLAIETFRAMEETVCRCRRPRWKPDGPGQFSTGGGSWVQNECSGCREWWRLHSILHGELGCRPWEFPCIEYPHWKDANPDRVALYRELEAAARGDPSPWQQRAQVISELEGEAPT